MCGIAGVCRWDGMTPDSRLVQQMTERMHHRGPDAYGYWQGGPVHLGHRRLSIIDLDGSAQPMVSADGRHVLVFNGEILNYRQLRKELDYPFITSGDTEVLLAGLVGQGPPFLSRVHGQFAFGLADTSTGAVLLGRDQSGILPLYYFSDESFVAFASEIKSLLLAIPRVRLARSNLDAYLARNAVPAPGTLFDGVKKVLPAATVSFDGSGRMTERVYWSPPSSEPGWRLDAAVRATRDALRDAVGAALVADVPVGTYLSGGLDSSLITAVVREQVPGDQLQTFSAGFEDAHDDELPWARRVAELLGTRHHAVAVRPDDFLALWPILTWHRDAPLSQPADVAVFRLAELARQHVKVVLSGEGSDELFAGYPKYRFVGPVEAVDVIPTIPRNWAYQRLRWRVPRRVGIVLRAAAAGDAQARRESWFGPFDPHERAVLLGSEPPPSQLPWSYDGTAVRRQLEHDFRTWLPDNLLERGDRMSMAASLEMRPPFLNQGLVDLAFRLPDRFKVRRGHTKLLVKQIGLQYLPLDVVSRPKVGFTVPLDVWFRQGLRSLARDLLLAPDSLASAEFDTAAVRALLERHDEGRRDEQHRLWTLLSLEIWYQQFFRATH